MKLRCTENSIRLRLRRSDVEKLATNEKVSVQIGFPAGSFLTYELSIGSQSSLTALFESGLISIALPQTVAKKWITTDEVGISDELRLPNGAALSILIEKDFPCKSRPGEDKTDTFQELVPENERDDTC